MVSFLRAGAVALVLMFALLSMPVQAGHGVGSHLDVDVPQSAVIVNGAPGQTVTFDVQNDGQDAMTEFTVEIGPASGDELIELTQIATTASGWTAGTPADADSDNNDDTVSLTGGSLDVAATMSITVTFDADELTLTSPAQEVTFTVTAVETGVGTDVEREFDLEFTNPTLVVSKTSMSVGEPDTSNSFTVALSHKPTASTTVNVAASNAHITLDKATLTFSTTDWATAQPVEATAVDDSVTNSPARTSTITIAVDDTNAPPAYDQAADATVTVTIQDNEGVAITPSVNTVSTTEGSSTGGSFTVALAKKPSSSVTVALAVNAAASTGTDDDVDLSKSSLTFSTSNWNVAQTVTVDAVDDAIVEGDDDIAVLLTATGAPEYEGVTASVTAKIADNDDPGLVVTETSGETETREDGRKDTITVKLAKQPAGDVVVDVELSNVAEILADVTDLTFTTTNWNTAQTIEFEGQDDSVRDGHQDVVLTLAIDTEDSHEAWHDLEDTNLTITNLDDEATVMVEPEELELGEGESGDYTLRLTIQPSSDVDVTLDLPSGLTANLAKVVFTPNNWDDERTITITAVDDSRKNGDRNLAVEHEVDSSDNRYTVADDLVVRVEDDDPIDIARANSDLQDSLKVERDGDDNVLTWDIGEADGDPAGVQIWRSQSPFKLLETLGNTTSDFEDEEFIDGGNADAFYIITVYYAETAERGFFTSADDLTDVPGYEDKDDDELEALAGSSGSESNTALIVGSIVGLLVLIGVIVLIVVLVRRKKSGDDDEWDDEPATEQGDSWDWDDFSSPPKEAPAQAQPAQDDAWPAEEQDSWDEPAEWDQPASKEWPQHEARAPARAAAPAPWPEDEPAKPAGGETFHLTCPQCRHDFSVHGRKPLVTECPNCHVEGVLR